MSRGEDGNKIGAGGPPRPPEGAGGDGPPARPILEPERLRRWERTRRGSGPRDLDRADRTQRLVLSLWSLAGFLMGCVAGFGLAVQAELRGLALAAALGGGLLGWALVRVVAGAIVSGAGAAATTVYMPGGRSGAPRREYSLAESLASRGRYDDAISVFELAAAEHPDDPVPPLRIARISRDHLDDPERAARWLKRARAVPGLDPGRERTISRELIELLRASGPPERAAPELARMVELHGDTAEGRWARAELAEVRRLVTGDRE